MATSSRVLAASRPFHPRDNACSQVPTASHVNIFLTNLHLLDLHLLPDWPKISLQTLASTREGQKRRIQCVEWALYRLFWIWDPEETRTKLQPYFPPHDQVQSLNLRAALLRCLEHAKKSGILGRDAVVRKTMLDECKGERLEEVLSSFSSAVLKKVVAGDGVRRPTQQLTRAYQLPPALAQRIALEHRGYDTDRTEIHVLLLAHKVALRRILEQRNIASKRYAEFSQMLDHRGSDLKRRKLEIEKLEKQRQNDNMPGTPKDTEALDQLVRTNWSGNELWMETLFYGDSGAKRDVLSAMPFDRIWRRVQSGRLGELRDAAAPGHSGVGGAGLLAQLESRSKAQQARLKKLTKFSNDLLASCPDTLRQTQEEEEAQVQSLNKPQQGIDLGFVIHESIRPGRMSPRKVGHSSRKLQTCPSHTVYARILEDMKRELAECGNVSTSSPLLSFLARDLSRTRMSHAEQTAPSSPPRFSESSITASDKIDDSNASTCASGSLSQASGVDNVKIDKPPTTKDPTSVDAMYQAHSIIPEDVHEEPNDYFGILPARGHGARLQDKPIVIPPAGENPISLPYHPKPDSLVNPEDDCRLSLVASKLGNPAADQTVAPSGQSAVNTISTSSLDKQELRSDSHNWRDTALLRPPLQPMNSTQALAEDILNQMPAFSPSSVRKPVGHHFATLEERTKLSMANVFSSTSKPNDRKPAKRTSELPTQKSLDDTLTGTDLSIMLADVDTLLSQGTSANFDVEQPPKDEPQEEADDLVARTRKSMAGYEVALQQAQQERRRSERRQKKLPQLDNDALRRRGSTRRGTVSRFLDILDDDSVQDDSTLTISGATGLAAGIQGYNEQDGHLDIGMNCEQASHDVAAVLAEELMQDNDADYESVFRSRPKIKTSPLMSPKKL